MTRVCAYEKCFADLDELGKRTDALFCNRDHKDQQWQLDASRRSKAAAKRNRETRALTLHYGRTLAVIAGRIADQDGCSDEVAHAQAQDWLRPALSDTAREELDRREGRVVV